MKRPYRVRVSCVYDDGRVEDGPWVEKRGEALLHLKDCKAQNFLPAADETGPAATPGYPAESLDCIRPRKQGHPQ